MGPSQSCDSLLRDERGSVLIAGLLIVLAITVLGLLGGGIVSELETVVNAL